MILNGIMGKPIYSEKKYLVPIGDKFSLFL